MSTTNTINQPIDNTKSTQQSSNPGTPKSVHNRDRPVVAQARLAIPYDLDEQGSIIVSDKTVSIKLVNMHTGAYNRGIPCTISFKRVKQLMKQKTCYYTGVPFEASGRYIRSMERVDNNKGYHDDNVVACTFLANQLKNDMELKHLKKMVKQISKHIK